MSTDTGFGTVHKFEDFLVTAIADLPEIDIMDPSGTGVAVVAGGEDGRVRIVEDGSDDDDVGAVGFGAVNWTAGGTDLYMEARLFISAITDYKLFVGFGDTVPSADETSFSMTTDTVTIDTMSDAIGIAYDGDATTKNLWAVAGKTDNVTVGQVLSSTLNPVAATAVTLGVRISQDLKTAIFSVNGKQAYRIDSDTTLIAAVDLVPGVWTYDQGTACNIDVDYIYARKGRATT